MFSVVIPLYNKELSVRGAVDSVLNQTFKEYEIIIVNDGSTDRSLEEVEKINDPRIRIISKSNGGVSSARNRGISEARFPWIAFLDADDLWNNNHLDEIKRMIDLFSNSFVFATSYVRSDGKIVNNDNQKNSIYEVKNYFKEAVLQSILWTSITVVNKSCFNLVGGFDESIRYGEDLDMWARLAKKYTIVKSKNVTATYKVDAENRAIPKSYPIDASILRNIDLRTLEGDELLYYKYIVINRVKHLIKGGQFLSFFKMLIRHNFRLF